MSASNAIPKMLSGQLSLDCAEIKITQVKKRLQYVGPGIFSLTPSGTIECKIFARPNIVDPYAALPSVGISSSGDIYTDEDFFELEAKGYDNSLWRAKRLIPNIDSSFSTPSEVIVRVLIPEIASVSRSFANDLSGIEIFIPNKVEEEWRALLGEWTVGAPFTGYTFRVAMARNNHVSVRLETRASLPDNIVMRILEALSFVVGETLDCSAYRRYSKLKTEVSLNSSKSGIAVKQRFSPLELRNPAMNERAREIFIRYLAFAMTFEIGNVWHTSSAHLSHARQASNNSLEAWGVGACVALEGIATLFPFVINNVDLEEIEKIQKATRDLVEELKVSSHIANRANGLIGQLKNGRVKDRLAYLIANGTIQSYELKAWEITRNKGVHTAKMTEKDFSDPSLQSTVSNILKVHVLINKLMLTLIRYHGPYTDYGSIGFPTKQT